ncbi:RNA polymerase sigma-70 factor [Hymenobacter jejuensis]|uniref:RNA polymerase sigma-70 factor n=1 Tax=Hymenobacter jejuensis TaxID=2502781 RepID=UPI0013FD0AB9|nr:RNA polymerase sigma-70 factor [Hymenobacter jejuensis]
MLHLKVAREFSDSDCLARLRAGDDQAFDLLFQQFAPGLCRFAFQHLKSHAEAEEIVQECFLKLWQRRHQLEENTIFKGYLYQAAYHGILNQLRRQQYWAFEDIAPNTLFAEASTIDSIEYQELEKLYKAALEQLPPKRRQIFTLSRQEGLSYTKIAQTLNISVKSVETQMAHALKFLRSYFRSHGTILTMVLMLLSTIGRK